MKNIITILLVTTLSATSNKIIAQRDSVIGIWKGTSICQIKDSPCHDEIVVFHLTKLPAKDSFNVGAYKIVNGQEDFMGDLGFVYNASDHTLISRDTRRDGIWKFTISGKSIEGTLHVKDALFRIIKVRKE